MKINKKKSGIIFFKRYRQKKQVAQEINGFPTVRKYKYLGLWIDEKLNWDDHLEHIENKIDKAMKILRIMKWKNTTVWKQTYAWMTYVVPHFRYGSLIWLNFYQNIRGQAKINDKLDKIQKKFNKVTKILYNLPKSTPNATLNKMMGNWNMKTLAIMSYSRCA